MKPVMRDHPTGHSVVLYDNMTGGLSSEIQMYRNVGPCYCKSGLSSEVGLLSVWSLITGFIVFSIIVMQINDWFHFVFLCQHKLDKRAYCWS